MNRLSAFSIAALGLLAVTGAATTRSGTVEHRPAPPLASIPTTLGGWTATDDAVPPEVVTPDPSAAARLRRTYRKGDLVVWVAVDYYADQNDAKRPSVSNLIYPGRGWSSLSERSYAIPGMTEPGSSLPANLVTMTAAGDRRATLYWYQLDGRAIASDHWYRAFVLYRRLVLHRVDGALVRVTSSMSTARDSQVLESLGDFVHAFQPALVGALTKDVKG